MIKWVMVTLALMVMALSTLFCQSGLCQARIESSELGVQLIDPVKIQSVFKTFVKKRFDGQEDQIVLSSIKVLPRRIWVPQGKVTLQIQPGQQLSRLGRVSLLVDILVDGIPRRRARVSGYVECYKKVVCARSGLSRGQIITSRDLEMVRMPVSKLRKRFFESPKQVIGLSAKHTVRAGQVLYGDAVAKPVLVKRGSQVMIVAESANILVKVPGIVQESGAQGDFVRVKNLDSKRVIVARVRDENTVYVNF